MLHHVNGFVDAIGQKHGLIDVGPACRALEADIICMGSAVSSFDLYDCSIAIY